MRSALRTHNGMTELAMAIGLYALYEVVRGFGSTTLGDARLHTADIVSLERHLGLFVERAVQQAVEGLPGLPMLLGFAYMSLHFGATAIAMIWVHRRHRERFALVRTTLVVSTAVSLAIYVLYPAAPPRLAGLGFADTVTDKAGINLSSDALGSLYNPFAAVPSLHFGYSLLVGVTVAALAGRRLPAVHALHDRRHGQPLHLRRRRRRDRRRPLLLRGSRPGRRPRPPGPCP